VILAWLTQQEPPIIPVMAASSDEQMSENLAALDLRLSAEEMERLNTAGA
jgi:diketogulonate reductase-like aldo/keto reductase